MSATGSRQIPGFAAQQIKRVAMQYRRRLLPGGTYFFTVVTFARRPFLCEPENIELLRHSFRTVKARHPFAIKAFVLLPNHMHCIWTLPPGDDRYPMRWNLIKNAFSKNVDEKWLKKPSDTRQCKREKAVWQRRYWEHTIRNEDDFIRHIEYIHYNPVKHGLVQAPRQWEHSSFHKFVRQEKYGMDWAGGGIREMNLEHDAES